MVGPYFILHYFVSRFVIISWERKLADCFTLIAFKCILTVSGMCLFLTVL